MRGGGVISRTRVLVVDDSVVVRKVLSDIIASDPTLELAGAAPSAAIALQKIPQVNPDVVMLDVEMPDMDGIEAARRIRQGWAKLPIIMCSTLTSRGADATLAALAAGATDYIAKPSNLGGPGSRSSFAAEVVAKIKGLAPAAADASAYRVRPLVTQRPRFGAASVDVLAIGCSTGGPNALATIFADLPGDLPVPIVVVQHMPPLFTRMLADRLSASSRVKVTEATHGMPILPGRAYIAPGNFHMTVARQGTTAHLLLDQEAPENSCRPAVDPLFRSVAATYGAGVLAVVLTGMGHDGMRGARAVHDAGGTVVVQDRASCVVPSMPGAVVDAGVADAVVPLARLAEDLTSRLRWSARPRAVASRSARMP